MTGVGVGLMKIESLSVVIQSEPGTVSVAAIVPVPAAPQRTVI